MSLGYAVQILIGIPRTDISKIYITRILYVHIIIRSIDRRLQYEKWELQRIRLIRIRPTITWKKCNPVRKKNRQL